MKSTGDGESPCGMPTVVLNGADSASSTLTVRFCLRQQKPYDSDVVCIKERMQNNQEFLSTDCIERT